MKRRWLPLLGTVLVVACSAGPPHGVGRASATQDQALVAAIAPAPATTSSASEGASATPMPMPMRRPAARLQPDGNAWDGPASDSRAWDGPVVPVPILYHHRVLPLPAAIGTWTAARRKGFLETTTLPWAVEAQLGWLQAHGYHTILPRDLAAHWDQGAPLPYRPVILTFDDGYPEWLTTLLPMLVRRGQVAEFYVTLDALASGSLSWADIRSLAAAGMGIGAHGVHHVQLAMLGAQRRAASMATMTYEVTESRRILGVRLGTPPDSMSYVGGGYDARLVSAARKAGYTTARALVRGVMQSPEQRWTMRVSRISVWDDVLDQNGCLAAPSEATCAIDPLLPTFARRVNGEDPG